LGRGERGEVGKEEKGRRDDENLTLRWLRMKNSLQKVRPDGNFSGACIEYETQMCAKSSEWGELSMEIDWKAKN